MKTKVKKKTKEPKRDAVDLPKKKSVVAKRRKTKEKKHVTEEKEDNRFSFDEEIVIGVTKKEEPKQEKQNPKQNKKRKKQIAHKKKIENTKQGKVTKKQDPKPVKRKAISQEEKEKREKKRKRTLHLIQYTMLGALLITVILCAMYSPIFNVQTIQVEGNDLITKKEIISLSQIQIEQNTFQLSKRNIEKQIKQNAYIEKVEIKRKLPSTILLQVEERKPAYLLEYAGSYVYLDKQGYMLEIKAEKLELPILQGARTQTSDFVVGNRLCREDLEVLSTVLKIMELAQENQINTLITRIDIEEKENLKLILETKEKVAYLGDSSNLNTKILTIKSILEKTEQIPGEIFVNKDLNKEYPVFRERV